MNTEWHDFKWGMAYGAALAVTIFIAFVLAVGYGGLFR